MLVFRYLLAGGANTALSYALYLVVLPHAGYRVAYVISFVGGIALSYLLLRFAVFKSPGRRLSPALVAVSHVGQLLLGFVVVELWVVHMRLPVALASLAAVAVCAPVMFMAHRWIFSHRQVPQGNIE